MSDELSPSEFLISKMEGMDDVIQVLIVTRNEEGEISYDTCGQIAADTLGIHCACPGRGRGALAAGFV